MINDVYGHETGDKALDNLARILEKKIRPQVTIAPIGGDELVILFDDVTVDDLVSKANRIFEELHFLILSVENQNVFVSIRVGILPNISEYPTPSLVLREADRAMYTAKGKC